MAEFFVICQPGLEEELATELSEFWPYLLSKDARPHADGLQVLEQTLGGVSLQCEEVIGYQINFFSKLASRVLLRLTSFKATDFGKLKEKLQKLNLDAYLGAQGFQLEVAAAKSRLNNEKRILEVCQQVWGKKINETSKLTIMIRVYDDRFMISLDTSGEHLHFRKGQKQKDQKKIGEAPLRETLAAFMARKLIAGFTLSELRTMELVDPMAGSGTLLSEAVNLYQGNFKRDFSFLHFKNCPKILKSPLLEKNYPHFQKIFSSLRASDQDADVIDILKENLQATDKIPVLQAQVANVIQQRPQGKGLLICNPPYGERLALNFTFEQLGHAVRSSDFRRIGVLLPDSRVTQFQKATKTHSYHELERCQFKNGGIPVTFLILQR